MSFAPERRPRVLVTGATGFTARYVIPLLQAGGYEVFELARSIEAGERRIACDIRDAIAVQDAVARVQPEYVVHLAGTQNLPDSSAELLFGVNVQGTVNLLEACARLANTPKKFVLPSSAYVYGDTGAEPADESAPLRPTNDYGRSKLEMEQAAARWFDRLPILIVRPFNYTGVGHEERFLVPKLVKVFRDKGKDFSFVDPNVVRDFSDVRWVAEVYAKALGLAETGRAVNVCSGIGVPIFTLVTLLERLTGQGILARTVGQSTQSPGKRLIGSARLIHALVGHSTHQLAETLNWMLEKSKDVVAPLD